MKIIKIDYNKYNKYYNDNKNFIWLVQINVNEKIKLFFCVDLQV
jgi:hypothetical protein